MRGTVCSFYSDRAFGIAKSLSLQFARRSEKGSGRFRRSGTTGMALQSLKCWQPLT